MFHSVSLLSQAPLARGSRAVPSVLLADGLLADAALIPPRPPIPPTNIRMVRGPVQKLVEMAICFSKKRDDLSITCNTKVMSRCLCYNPTSLPQDQAEKTKVRSRSLCTWGNHDNFRITGSISKILGPERSP